MADAIEQTVPWVLLPVRRVFDAAQEIELEALDELLEQLLVPLCVLHSHETDGCANRTWHHVKLPSCPCCDSGSGIAMEAAAE